MTVRRPRRIIAGSGQLGEPRKLSHVVSVRADARLLDDICRLALADGTTVSDWIRNAAAAAVYERGKPAELPGYRHVGWRCAHLTLTAGAGLGAASCGGGCEMQPAYEPVLTAA